MWLDDGLKRLGEANPRQARVVELRYFGGLSVDEIARILDLSSRSVKRDWSLARIWLFRHLNPDLPVPIYLADRDGNERDQT
jgi:RNA polymerase sigma-70 factor (ECF subfamily)